MKRIASCLLFGLAVGCAGEPPLALGGDEGQADATADDVTDGSEAGDVTDGSGSDDVTGAETDDSPGTDAAQSDGAAGTDMAGAPLTCSDAAEYGQEATTQTYDGETHLISDHRAACRATGERVMLFVQDDLYDNPVSQPEVDALLARLEEDGGILSTLEQNFAPVKLEELPGGKIPIFVIDTGRAGEGYVCGWCENWELHLDGKILSPLDGDRALGIAAHELFHIVHRGYDPDELPWVDETLAQAAMVAAGFSTNDQDWLARYLSNPNVNWGPGNVELTAFDYGAGLTFGTYLWEQGGAQLMRAATLETEDDWLGLDLALEASGTDATALQMFQRMAAALYLDDPETGFGFEALDVELGSVTALSAGQSETGVLEPYGLVYLELDDGVTNLRLDGTDAVLASALTQEAELVDIELGSELERGSETVVILTATERSEFELSVW